MKVLTIDIDYAFSPSISFYDDHVIGARISLKEQKSILSEKKCPPPVVNTSKFNQIRKVFDYFKQSAKVVTIEHHHEILEHIPDQVEIHLQNIDHHHDIFYPGWHQLECLDEGNWVYHLSKTNNLKSYAWFKNPDSEAFCNCIDLNFKFSQHLDLKPQYLTKPDIIILCSSPHWTDDVEGQLIKKLLRGTDDNA